MHPLHRVKVFADRFPLLGPFIWILTIEYYIIQILVAAAWMHPIYSWRFNTISDLGATMCGVIDGRAVCSPLYLLLDGALVAVGILMAGGSLFIYQEFRERPGTLLGFSLMAIAGLGSAGVGLFPENVNPVMHTVSAATTFLLGNLSLLLLGVTLYKIPNGLRLYTLLSGALSLGALALFVAHLYGPLGIGGMERVVAYPQTMWLFVFGLYMSRNHISQSRIVGRLRRMMHQSAVSSR